MFNILVRFDRASQTDGDLEIALKRFPGTLEEVALTNQLSSELEQSQELSGLWYVFDSLVIDDDRFCAWVAFDWNGSIEDFARVLQKVYDVHGMSGSFIVLSSVCPEVAK